MADSPYPELKKTHTMAHVGRPFTDYKPPAGGAGVGRHRGVRPLPRPGLGARARRLRRSRRSSARRPAARTRRTELGVLGAAPGDAARRRRRARAARSPSGPVRTQRHGSPLSRLDLAGVDGRPDPRVARSAGELGPAHRHGTTRSAGRADRERSGRVLRAAGRGHVHDDQPLRDARRPAAPLLAPSIDPRVLDLGAGGAPWAIAVLDANARSDRRRQRSCRA